MLSATQRCLIEYVYAQFRATNEWPRSWRVELDLEDTLEPAGGLLAVCRSLGNDSIVCESPTVDSSTVKLRLPALALLPEAASDVSAFLSLCRYAAEVYRRSAEQPSQISLSAFVEQTRIKEDIARRAFLIALLDGKFSSGGSTEHFQLSNFAPRLATVQSIAEIEELWTTFFERNYGPVNRPTFGAGASIKFDNKIFLSHAASDTSAAQYLARLIRSADQRTSIFVASVPGHIHTGEDWFATIRSELRSAAKYVVLVSQRSIDRPWIWFETGAAWFSERQLLPVILPGLPKTDVPLPLGAFQMLSLDSERETEQFFSDLGVAVPDIEAVVRHMRSLGRLEQST